MKKTITCDVAGIVGTGNTLTEARKDAQRKVELALDGDYTPRLIECNGLIAVIWRTPTGYCSAYLHDCSSRIGGFCMHGTEANFDTVERQCRFGLAQQKHDIDDDRLPPLLHQCPPGMIADWYSWLGWQRAFRRHRHEHPEATDAQCHQWASDHAHEFNPAQRKVAA